MVDQGASLDGRLFLWGTDGSNPVPSSGESDPIAVGVHHGSPEGGDAPTQASIPIKQRGIFSDMARSFPLRESPPGSKSASMIGQHRPLSQSAENHLSRGHGCSNVQQSRPTSRAPKN